MNKEILLTLGADKLADMLLALRKGSDEVNLELDVVLAGAEETPDKLASLLHKEVATLKNMTTFYGSYRADLIAYRIYVLRRYITQNLRAMSASKVMELLLALIDAYENIMKHVDDYEGMVEGVFIDVYDDLNKLCQYVEPPTEALVDAITKRCINATNDTYYRLLFNFKNVLQENEEVLDLIQERIEQSLKDEDNEYTLRRRIQHLKHIAEIRQNTEAYIQACNIKGALNDSDCIIIAKQLIAQQRATEALTWLEKVSDSKKIYNGYKETYVRALAGIGELKKAQEEYFTLFKESLDADLYKDVMAQIRPEDKASFKEKTLQTVYQGSQHTYGTLHFLIYSENYDEASTFIRLHINDMSICVAWAFDNMVLLLQEIDPLAATLLYRKMIAYVLEKEETENYRYASNYVMMCAVLATKVNDWEMFTPHEVYVSAIREIYESNEQFRSVYMSTREELISCMEECSREQRAHSCKILHL